MFMIGIILKTGRMSMMSLSLPLPLFHSFLPLPILPPPPLLTNSMYFPSYTLPFQTFPFSLTFLSFLSFPQPSLPFSFFSFSFHPFPFLYSVFPPFFFLKHSSFSFLLCNLSILQQGRIVHRSG